MAYRIDEDLEFLRFINSNDLNDLVFILTKDENGSSRITEELTGTGNYKRYYPDHQKYWKEIAAEIQCFGANTFATLFRGGKGVLYREVLIDVAEKLSVEFDKSNSTSMIEKRVLLQLIHQALRKADYKQLSSFAQAIGLPLEEHSMNSLSDFTERKLFSSPQEAAKIASIIKSLVSYKKSKASALLSGESLAMMSLFSIGVATQGGVFSISAPAYRVTIPAVLQIALLRIMYDARR